MTYAPKLPVSRVEPYQLVSHAKDPGWDLQGPL